ncbi:MAG TPA: hypothetical protein VGV07_21995 [Devosia sp.]|jgi:hypothetical protein|uniref:hypothetical protein n=1 Tax=Devosia sp. TaxID=1871048 RepID=UPI002DDD1ECD|nr:hypothetical protein [Devosia sp.]HEV2517939.1 hypothetical protein [Devosia sp.]
MSENKARKSELPLSLEGRQTAIKRLREIFGGSMPADFQVRPRGSKLSQQGRQHGQLIAGRLRIVNPFLQAAGTAGPPNRPMTMPWITSTARA